MVKISLNMWLFQSGVTLVCIDISCKIALTIVMATERFNIGNVTGDFKHKCGIIIQFNDKLTDAELEAKVKEYCNLARPAVEAQKEVFDNLGMSAEIKAEGFDCITEYTYKEQMEVDTDALNRQLELSWSTYKAMYDELHAYTGSDRVRVVLRYINADGTKILDYIVDKTYHAE